MEPRFDLNEEFRGLGPMPGRPEMPMRGKPGTGAMIGSIFGGLGDISNAAGGKQSDFQGKILALDQSQKDQQYQDALMHAAQQYEGDKDAWNLKLMQMKMRQGQAGTDEARAMQERQFEKGYGLQERGMNLKEEELAMTKQLMGGKNQPVNPEIQAQIDDEVFRTLGEDEAKKNAEDMKLRVSQSNIPDDQKIERLKRIDEALLRKQFKGEHKPSAMPIGGKASGWFGTGAEMGTGLPAVGPVPGGSFTDYINHIFPTQMPVQYGIDLYESMAGTSQPGQFNIFDILRGKNKAYGEPRAQAWTPEQYAEWKRARNWPK